MEKQQQCKDLRAEKDKFLNMLRETAKAGVEKDKKIKTLETKIEELEKEVEDLKK